MSITVAEAHPELLHYTSVGGLSGILESQSLHATDSGFLNDSMEIELFFDRRLGKVLEAGIRAELAADPQLRVLPQFARTPEEAAASIRRYATEMAQAIRTTTTSFNQPFLFCLSAPANSRVVRDGLLSQWRGYGKDGGYAIVFDTVRFEELLKAECSSFWYQHAQWGDVHYHQDDEDLAHAEPEIEEAEAVLRKSIASFIKNPVPEELEPTFSAVTTLSCLYKHWGFHEEREVRIIAIPPNGELIREGRASGEVRPIREIKTFIRNGTPVPYIDLFARHGSSDQDLRLPITRIIVGPHPQSSLRRNAVERMLQAKGIAADVWVSQIPFVLGW